MDEKVPWDGGWVIAGQGAVNQYHEVVILERDGKRIAVWLPRDEDLAFVVENARIGMHAPKAVLHVPKVVP